MHSHHRIGGFPPSTALNSYSHKNSSPKHYTDTPMPEPKRHLSLYLMKKGTSIDETIRDPSKVSRHDLVNIDSDGTLFVKTSHGELPWWVEFLDPLSPDDIKAPASRTTSAVLSLSLNTASGDTRTVCYTFGHGRHLLDQNRIDRAFGLRVALNTINPRETKGTRHTSSRGSSCKFTFPIEYRH